MNKITLPLERLLHQEIPLTRAMKIRVAAYDGNSLTLEAPLSDNQNHTKTAFGGSLYSLAALSGWGLLHLRLQEARLQGHIVIYEARVSYRSPVTDTLVARCAMPDEAGFARFLRTFQRKGMARLQLTAEIPGAIGAAVSFQGTYVVHT